MKTFILTLLFTTFLFAQEDSLKASSIKGSPTNIKSDSLSSKNYPSHTRSKRTKKKDRNEEAITQEINYNTGWFIGYLANITNAPIGLNVGYISKGFGIYFSFVTGLKDFSDDNFYENISESESRNTFGDRQTDEDNVYQGYSLGTIFSLFSNLKIYGGLTLYKQAQYLNFYDEFHILGDNGSYWIKSSKESEVMNFNLGLFFFFKDDWYLQFGGTFKPSGIELGVGKSF